MEDRLPRRRAYGVRAMLAVASVLAALSIFAVWANRQALNASNWSNTSAALLEDPAIKTQLSAFLVDQVYANTDVTAQVRGVLPPRLQPLAGPAANGVRQLAERTTTALLGRPRVEGAWKAANEVTAQQFINIAEGRPGPLTASGNSVVLDLHALALAVVQRLGLPGKLASKLPPDAGRLTILNSSQIGAVRAGASALRGLALVLPVLALGLFAGAVALARGRRRQTLFWVGIDLCVAGAVVLIARNLIGSSVVDSLAPSEAVRPAAQNAWSIGTRMLRDVGQATIIGALPLLAAAWLAGPTRAAVAARRALAPVLRDRAGVTYAVVAIGLLLIVAWEPIPATHKVVPMLVMAGLAFVGVEVLRRQTAEEFPHAQIGDIFALVRNRPGRRARGGDSTPVAAAAAADEARLGSLERLATLHDRGLLSDEEFATEKAAMLAGG